MGGVTPMRGSGGGFGRVVQALIVSAVFALCLAAASTALAQPASVAVADLGQPSAPVIVGQPPISALPMGACAATFTISSQSACPTGAWPALGSAWGSLVHVGGGDTLRLTFSEAVSGASVASTSNYEPNLHDPEGGAITNYDVLPETPATPTTDPATWLVTLPPLDYRAMSTQGYTLSVVANQGSAFSDYPVGIKSPRYEDESAVCSEAVFSTGLMQGLCKGNPGSPRSKPIRPPDHGPFGVMSAQASGSLVTMKIQVPVDGKLLITLPTQCSSGGKQSCSQTQTIVRHVRENEVGQILVTRKVALRYGAGRQLLIPLLLETPPHETREARSAVRLKVRP